MHLIMHSQAMAVLRLPGGHPAPEWAQGEPLVCVTRTADETSVLCPTSALPDDPPGPVEGPFLAVRVAGTINVSQVGVLVSLLQPLAAAGISVLTVSTYDTDWILVPPAREAEAAAVWRAAGHEISDELTDDIKRQRTAHWVDVREAYRAHAAAPRRKDVEGT